MFTALEGPGIGHREQLQPDPGGGLCIEPELIKRVPPGPRFILVCLSFHRGALGPPWRCLGPRPCSLGATRGLAPLLFLGLRRRPGIAPEVGQKSGREWGFHRPRDLRVGGGRWAVGHLSPDLPAEGVAEGPGPGHHSGRMGTHPSVESHSRVWFWDGPGPSLSTAPRIGFALSRPVSFSMTVTGYMWPIFS